MYVHLFLFFCDPRVLWSPQLTSAVSDNRQWAELAGDETRAAVAQLVERVLGKDEVTGPNPVSSSQCSDDRSRRFGRRISDVNFPCGVVPPFVDPEN